MPIKGLKRSIFQRILGICATPLPGQPGCWTQEGSAVSIDLGKAPELTPNGGAIRIEGKKLPQRVLLFRGDDGVLRAFENACAHKHRRVDPVPGEGVLQCCSVNAAAYDYKGTKLEGPGDGGIRPLDLTLEGARATIRFS